MTLLEGRQQPKRFKTGIWHRKGRDTIRQTPIVVWGVVHRSEEEYTIAMALLTNGPS